MSGDGGTVVAGALYNAAGGSDRGAAYVYKVQTNVYLPLILRSY